MRSIERARYEAGLSQIARGARQCATVLDGSGDQEACWEFQLLAAWVAGELERSLANRRPMRKGLKLVRLAAPEQD